ncbi:hypothetical protein [Endozoicomonas sp. ONNA1]|nr:hypothetical protein [Endozoicomonas sp. ONNA1]
MATSQLHKPDVETTQPTSDSDKADTIILEYSLIFQTRNLTGSLPDQIETK